jgi:hypothetical protein
MTEARRRLAYVLGVWVLGGGIAAAQEAAAPEAAQLPQYRPPLRGAPARTLGGGTRGTRTAVVLSVLAPDHVGLTTKARPTLYWYVSQTPTVPIELTLVDERKPDPVLEVRLPAVDRGGIHAVDLGKHGVDLDPGVTYDWSVALVVDAQQRSKDVVTTGAVKRVELPPATAAKLAAASPEQAAYLYAEAGVWYDAYAAIAARRAAAPADAKLEAEQAALLEQVGLGDVTTPAEK